jgi:hypothetical protein
MECFNPGFPERVFILKLQELPQNFLPGCRAVQVPRNEFKAERLTILITGPVANDNVRLALIVSGGSFLLFP